MAEKKNDEKTIVVAYIVKRMSNGDIDVEDAKLNGTKPISDEEIFKDIEDVNEAIQLKRSENAAYSGIARFYSDVAAKQAEMKNKEAEAPAKSPVVPPKK